MISMEMWQTAFRLIGQIVRKEGSAPFTAQDTVNCVNSVTFSRVRGMGAADRRREHAASARILKRRITHQQILAINRSDRSK